MPDITPTRAVALELKDERRAMRHEVNRAHATVHSGPSDPVPYDAFDQDHQFAGSGFGHGLTPRIPPMTETNSLHC